MQPILSVCIPVYNCGEYIAQTLDSILLQSDVRVEVVVYDGGSTDNTESLIEKYITKWPNLRYYKSETRGGIDADMARCVSFAHGDYCWLFSGDDVMRPNSISRALEVVSTVIDVYISKHTICNINMRIIREHPVLMPDRSLSVDFSDSKQRLDWFNKAETSEAFFSFMSSLIVRKAKWDAGRLIPEFDGSCWGHVARLLELSKSGLTVSYLCEILLDQRGDNDSFADKGVVNRFKIGIEGYHNLANYFYGANSEEAFHIRRVIRNEFKLQSLLSAKIQTLRHPNKESKDVLDKLVSMAYQDKSLTNFTVRFLYKKLPYSFFLIARFFYRFFLKNNYKN